jgi:prevent-host-death family protein
MRSTSTVYEAKAKLSALINQVLRTGEPLVLTRYGKPVAKLIPCDEHGDSDAEVLAHLHTAAKQSGIAYTVEQLTAPLPVEEWGTLAVPTARLRKKNRR